MEPRVMSRAFEEGGDILVCSHNKAPTERASRRKETFRQLHRLGPSGIARNFLSGFHRVFPVTDPKTDHFRLPICDFSEQPEQASVGQKWGDALLVLASIHCHTSSAESDSEAHQAQQLGGRVRHSARRLLLVLNSAAGLLPLPRLA